MLPGALRRRGAKAPGQRVRNFGKRRGTGEKGHKRMAQAGCVFDVAVPDEPRTPEQILARQPGQPPPQAPEMAGTWYTADITGGAAQTIAALFGQAGAVTPPVPGPGSRWPTGTTTRSGRSRTRPRPAAWPSRS